MITADMVKSVIKWERSYLLVNSYKYKVLIGSKEIPFWHMLQPKSISNNTDPFMKPGSPTLLIIIVMFLQIRLNVFF